MMLDDHPLVLLDGWGVPRAGEKTAIALTLARLPVSLHPRVQYLRTSVTPSENIASRLGLLAQNPLSWVGYIPLANHETIPLPVPRLNFSQPFLAPWVPTLPFPVETAQAAPCVLSSWLTSPDVMQAVVTELSNSELWTMNLIAAHLEHQEISFQWRCLSEDLAPSPKIASSTDAPTVIAIVPHYRCEPWLRRCLTSLVKQTRLPDLIVVVDDASDAPPVDIVADFPMVTLLRASANVGPYRLLQSVIEATIADYYLFQDADDWSSCDRLAQLLNAAESTGAVLVGTQEIRVDEDGSLRPIQYPLDVNRALAEKPGHPLLHPTSLVRRSLVTTLGGFATGLRFGGDTEFLLRAVWAGKIMNVPHYGYFRRKRSHSLTTAPETGLDSPARRDLLITLKQRAIDRLTAARIGEPLDLQPLRERAPVPLEYLRGPALTSPPQQQFQ